MEELRRQVSRARRRLTLQQFLGIATWVLFAAFLLAAAALAIPKIWAIGALSQPAVAPYWAWGWLIGAATLGLIVATVWTCLVRRGEIQAAIEIDRRFGLKERVSSSLSLGPADVDSEFGRALVSDASRRVERIDVREKFGVGLRWHALLPLIPAAIAFVLITVPNAIPEKATQATENKIDVKTQTKKSIEALKKKVAQAKKIAGEKGLEDAEVHLKELLEKLDKLESDQSKLDRKNAMLKLNDLKQELQDRRKQLGSADDMRKQMNNLKNIERGPADKLVQAMKDGDMQKALDELKNLQEQLNGDGLNEEQQQQLAKQLDQMKEKLQDVVARHDAEKEDLERQIKEKIDAGDRDAAQQLQQQLDKLKQQDDRINQLDKLAQQLGQCAECMNGKQGGAQQAGEKLKQIANQLKQMQKEMDELEALDDVMKQIAEAKNAMDCKQCNGGGCKACQGAGFGQGQGKGDGKGNGLGEGEGQGYRPERETETGEFLSRVRGNPQPGEAVRQGDAGGPNKAGRTWESVKAEVLSDASREVDPVNNQRVPRDQRDHAKQYFEKFRKGE